MALIRPIKVYGIHCNACSSQLVKTPFRVSSGMASPPSIGTTHTCQNPPRSLANATHSPSGLTVGNPSWAGSSVSRTSSWSTIDSLKTSQLPSALTHKHNVAAIRCPRGSQVVAVVRQLGALVTVGGTDPEPRALAGLIVAVVDDPVTRRAPGGITSEREERTLLATHVGQSRRAYVDRRRSIRSPTSVDPGSTWRCVQGIFESRGDSGATAIRSKTGTQIKERIPC